MGDPDIFGWFRVDGSSDRGGGSPFDLRPATFNDDEGIVVIILFLFLILLFSLGRVIAVIVGGRQCGIARTVRRGPVTPTGVLTVIVLVIQRYFFAGDDDIFLLDDLRRYLIVVVILSGESLARAVVGVRMALLGQRRGGRERFPGRRSD